MIAFRVLSIALLVMVAGCTRFKAPGIAVVDAALVESTDEACRFDVALEVMNPNDEAMELREFSYSFSVAGGTTFTGRWSLGRTLAPGRKSEVKVPAVVVVDAAQGPEVSWTMRGNVLYVSPGALAEILLDAEVREPRARFRASGKTPLVATP